MLLKSITTDKALENYGEYELSVINNQVILSFAVTLQKY